jgi:hypothetical protein
MGCAANSSRVQMIHRETITEIPHAAGPRGLPVQRGAAGGDHLLGYLVVNR